MKNTTSKRTLAAVISLALAASLTACAPMNSDTRRSDTESELLSEVFPETDAELRDDEENIETTVTAEEITEISASYITRENDKWKFFKFDGDHSKKIGIRNADYLEVKSNELCLSDFEYSPNIEDLVISELSSNDLSGIENFPNIKRLEMDQGTHISDISDIVRCKNIEILTFHLTDPANDYSYLGELENLKELRVILTGDDNDKEYKAVNIESISSCKNLEVLGLQHFYMDNMDFLKPLKNLKTLNFMTTCQESMDISPLLGMEKLEELVITHCNSDDVSVFLQLGSLKRLEIYGDEYSQESIDKLNEAFSGRDIVV